MAMWGGEQQRWVESPHLSKRLPAEGAGGGEDKLPPPGDVQRAGCAVAPAASWAEGRLGGEEKTTPTLRSLVGAT